MLSNFIKSTLLLLFFCATFTFAQNVNEHSIKFESSTTATLVGEDGVIMKTTNLGATWEDKSSGITNALYGNSSKSGISLAAGENGVILRSDDNGENWVVILPGTLENLNDAEVVSSQYAVVCGNNGTILFSDNGGNNWSTVTSGVTYNLSDVKFVSESTGFISGDGSTLLKTVDHGATWQPIDMSFCTSKFNAVEAINENNIILVGDEGTMFISNDGGISWQGNPGAAYSNNFNDVVFFDALNGVIAGNDGLILKTSDGGNSWYESNTNFAGDGYDLFSVAFANSNVGISTGRDGIEVYTTDGGDTWTETAPMDATSPRKHEKNDKESGVTLIQNYPNPFNPTTNITFETAFDASVSLRVYDVTGKVVAELVSGFQKAGSHTVNFNASNLASGVYFYALNVNAGGTEVKKIMKMILTK